MADAGSGLEVETKFGSIRAHGTTAMLLVGLLVAFALGIYVLHQDHLAALAALDRISDANDLQTYMLTLPPEERVQIPIRTPKKLKTMGENP